MVLNVSVLGVAVERIQIEKLGDIRMCCRAVIAFVEVVCQDLPVILAVQLVGIIEVVVVEVVGLVSVLLVDVFEVLLPRHLGRLVCIHIHPDKAVDIDLDMDAKEPVLALVEAIQFLVLRGFGQRAVQSIGPAVIPAGQDFGIPFALLLDHGVRTVSADVVERVDGALPVTDDEEVKTRNLIPQPVAGFLQPRAVGDEKPSPGEDGAAFELIHLRGGVP